MSDAWKVGRAWWPSVAVNGQKGRTLFMRGFRYRGTSSVCDFVAWFADKKAFLSSIAQLGVASCFSAMALALPGIHHGCAMKNSGEAGAGARCPHCHSGDRRVECANCSREMCESCVSSFRGRPVCGLCFDRLSAKRCTECGAALPEEGYNDGVCARCDH